MNNERAVPSFRLGQLRLSSEPAPLRLSAISKTLASVHELARTFGPGSGLIGSVTRSRGNPGNMCRQMEEPSKSCDGVGEERTDHINGLPRGWTESYFARLPRPFCFLVTRFAVRLVRGSPS